MDYSAILERIFNAFPMYHRVGASAYKEGLENIEALLAAIGHPERKFKAVHIAGTNGKGSVSHLLSSFFQEAGFKTGLFTSPHLLDFSERIRLNGQNIDEEYVVRFFERYDEKIKAMEPSFFEITTALAFDYFAYNQVDMAIIETGLGGRLDATNVLRPVLSVITNISLEHTALLGNTIAKIAAEKAGIIKQDTPVVIGETHPESLPVFQAVAAERHADLAVADEQFSVVFQEPFDAMKGHRMLSVYQGERLLFENVKCPLQGDYQQKNVTTFVAAASFLCDYFSLNQHLILEAIENVQKNVFLPGRWQTVATSPLTICDTGHNYGCLSNTLVQLNSMPCKKLHFVVGFVNDKELAPIFPLLPKDAAYYACAAPIERALPAEVLAARLKENGLVVTCCGEVEKAYAAARTEATADDVIFVGGSTFVVAEFLKRLSVR